MNLGVVVGETGELLIAFTLVILCIALIALLDRLSYEEE